MIFTDNEKKHKSENITDIGKEKYSSLNKYKEGRFKALSRQINDIRSTLCINI